MSTTQKPQRTFLAVTLLTVVAVTTVFLVYAAVLMTLYGSTVTINETSGSSMQYSLDGSTWSSSLSAINNGTAWYGRVNITNAASQAVTIQWTLQQNTGSWVDVDSPVTTTITLSTGTNIVYATASGASSGNYNWGSLTTSGGSYRVKAVVNG